MTKHNSGHYLLEALVDCGVDYIFGNFGTDHVTVVEELARFQQEGRAVPQVVICPHENVAVHMAGGYAAATGRGQAVLVHVDAGTANAAMGLHNLARTRLPVLVMAGRSPHTLRGELTGSRDNYVHFVQDPFDIAAIVRNYVKWEYSLPTGVVTKEVIRRAHSVMMSDPKGPVYLTLPRETLAEEFEDAQVASFPGARYGAVRAGGIAPAMAAQIADELMAARNPIAVTCYLGRNPEAVAVLDELAHECGIRVFEAGPSFLNIPRNSACFAGYDAAAAMEQTDLGLLLDVDVPWIPKFAPHAGKPRWLHIDVDAIKADFPMWGFATDLRVQADCATALAQVLDAVRAKSTPEYRAAMQARIESWEPVRGARQARLAEAASRAGASDAVSAEFVCATLAKKLTARDVVVNEAIRSAAAVLNQVPRSEPGTYFNSGGGGLGSAAGLALGALLADRDRRVVMIVGDGVFQFSNPDAVFAVAWQYNLPVFTIVLDNRGWQAVKESVLRVYPKGAAAETDNFQARLDGRQQGAPRHFEQIGAAFGAHAERVVEPAELEAAIDRCLEAVARGQAAVMTVRTAIL